jgi:hypothetical protein
VRVYLILCLILGLAIDETHAQSKGIIIWEGIENGSSLVITSKGIIRAGKFIDIERLPDEEKCWYGMTNFPSRGGYWPSEHKATSREWRRAMRRLDFVECRDIRAFYSHQRKVKASPLSKEKMDTASRLTEIPEYEKFRQVRLVRLGKKPKEEIVLFGYSEKRSLFGLEGSGSGVVLGEYCDVSYSKSGFSDTGNFETICPSGFFVRGLFVLAKNGNRTSGLGRDNEGIEWQFEFLTETVRLERTKRTQTGKPACRRESPRRTEAEVLERPCGLDHRSRAICGGTSC